VIFTFIERQMLDQWLTINAHPFLACAADCFMRLLAGCVHHIKRHTGLIGNHDGAVGRFTFHFRRA